MSVLYTTPASPPRTHEVAPPILAALMLWLHHGGPWSVLPSAAYLAYLWLDGRRVPQSRLAKWIRNVSPVVFLLALGPLVLRRLGTPPVAAGAALVAILAGATFPYLYARRTTAMTFLRGLVLALALEAAAQCLWPAASGAHAALALYAAAFAIGGRTVFWPYAAVTLVAYGIGVPLWIGWSPGLALHVAAGVGAAAVALAAPLRDGRPRSFAASLAPSGPIE
jgi:hypothetical protein